MKRLVALALLAACSGAAQPPAKTVENTALPTGRVSPATDREEIASAVLARWIEEPLTIPDAGELKGRPPFVLIDQIDPAHIDAPKLRGKIEWRTLAQLQQIADSTTSEVAYIRFHAIRVDGDSAEVSVGPAILFPKLGGSRHACCCNGTYVYARHPEGWVFVRAKDSACP